MNIRKLNDYIRLKYLVVPKAPEIVEGKKVIACIGDSITFGHGVDGVREKTWPYLLARKFSEKLQVLNYGISGRTLMKEGDFPYTKEKFYKLSQQVPAKLYLIMLGTNDTKPHNWHPELFKAELESFVKSYIDLPHQPRVILMTPPACFPDETTGVVNYTISGELVHGPVAAAVRETAEKLGLPCIDLCEFTLPHPEWFPDGVHPAEEGDKAIAEKIFEELIG